MNSLLPFTSTQQDIYFDQCRYPNHPIYNIGAQIEIKGVLMHDLINQAYEHLLLQHEVLCCVPSRVEEGMALRELTNFKKALVHIDYSTQSDAAKHAHQFIQEDFKCTWNLETTEVPHDTYLIKIANEHHILYSKYHHIITDGWGTSLLFQRLIKNYNELLESSTIQSEYPFEYADFIENNLDYLKSEKYQADKGYWLKHLKQLPERPFPEQAKLKLKSQRKEIIIKRENYNRLVLFAKENRSSVFYIMIATLACYIYKFAGVKDLIIGLPVLNRSTKQFKKTVGLFMGVSPLRIKIDEEESLLVLLNQIKSQLRTDYRYQRFPLGHLIKSLGLYDEESTLFDITLSYEKHDYSTAFKGTTVKVYPISHQAERKALAVYVREFDECEDVQIDFDYNISLLEEQVVQNMLEVFPRLLELITEQSNTPLKVLDVLTAKEKNLLTNIFNDTQVSYSETETLQGLINQVSKKYPHHIAISDKHQQYSYQELELKTNAIAAYLQNQYGLDQSPVGVVMERSADLLLILIGVLKSGRPYIPLDPKFPLSRLQYILQNSAAKLLITDSEKVDGLDDVQMNECQMITKVALMDQLDPELSLTKVIHDPDATAYIIYTSGSTGYPKGVEVGHRSVVNFLESMREKPGIESNDVLLAVTTFSFDISVLEFFLPLIVGANCYIVDQTTLADPMETISLIAHLQPNVIQATPSFYQLLFNAGWKGADHLKVLCGGDVLGPTLAGQLLNSCKELWNMYGPTETTIWSSTKKVEEKSAPNNIGSPINNTSFYILDQALRLKPIGATGDIYIGGAGLAKGYYKDVSRTKKAFVKNPLDQQLIYKTGDIGKWTNDGEIIFLGRSDNQVKIRGYRIELGEIETRIEENDSIDKAVVIAKKQSEDSSYLVAYLKQKGALNIDAVIEELMKKLPSYMVPRILIPLEEFPLTPNKKIDRKVLMEMAITSRKEIKKPHTETEQTIKNIWEDILGVSVRSTEDDFFSLGGHSLKAVELIKALFDRMNVKITLEEIFKYSTLRALSVCVARKEYSFTTIATAPQRDYYDLTPNQLGIWLNCQKSGANIAYNMYSAYTISGVFNSAAFEEAINHLIRHNEILRTNFVRREGVPKQYICKEKELVLEEVNSIAEEDIESIIKNYVLTPFNLSEDLLLKILWINKKTVVFLTHHIIMDGWSLNILLKSLVKEYNFILREGTVRREDPRNIQFKDYAEWSQLQVGSSQYLKSKNYWKDRLKNFTGVEYFRRYGQEQSYQGEKIDLVIQADLIDNIATSLEISRFSVLLTIINVLIVRCTSRETVGIGIPVSNRMHPSVQTMIGLTVNTILFKLKIKEEDQFNEICQKVHTYLQQDLTHEAYPFQQVLKDSSSTKPLFDIMLVYQNPDTNISAIKDFENFDLLEKNVAHSTSRFPIAFNFITKNDHSLHCEIEYDLGLFEQETIYIIHKKLIHLLDEIAKGPTLPIGHFDLEIEEEKELERTQIDIQFKF